jgi:hypothetical protein
LTYQVLEQAGGVPPGAVDDLARSARAAGLEVVAVGGSFTTTNPELGFELHASTMLAARERAIASGVAAEQQRRLTYSRVAEDEQSIATAPKTVEDRIDAPRLG